MNTFPPPSHHTHTYTHQHYTGSTTGLPPPYTTTSTTTKSNTGPTTSYEEEDDVDLNFTDDFPSQPYLSLGLTPPSQLSPEPNPNDFGFFPSMLPPVSPAASMFPSSGIPVDSPFNLSSGQQPPAINGMPEAIPSESKRRRVKHDPLSQGYGIRLETVPEQSGSVEDCFSEPYNAMNGRHLFGSNSSDETRSESTNLLFPSAHGSGDLAPIHLQRHKGKRRKSGTRRMEHGVEPKRDYGATSETVFSNRAVIENGFDDDIPVKLEREDRSPRRAGKHLRQRQREKELEKQKELLMKRAEEDERQRRLAQKQRIARDLSRNHETSVDYGTDSNSIVLKQAAKFDAKAQLMAEQSGRVHGSQSPMIYPPPHKIWQTQASHEHRPSREGSEISLKMFDQVTTL